MGNGEALFGLDCMCSDYDDVGPSGQDRMNGGLLQPPCFLTTSSEQFRFLSISLNWIKFDILPQLQSNVPPNPALCM